MNKKITAILMAMILAVSSFGLMACGEKENSKETHEHTSQETVREETVSEGFTEESKKSEMVEAPDFTVLDWEGKEVSLKDFRGKPVILNFWATWCGPCKNEMPDFNELYQEYGEEIHFVMVNMTDGTEDTIDSVKEFIEETGYEFPVYFDTEMSAAVAYGVSGIPVTYIIDKDGYAVAKGQGSLTKDILQSGIDLVYPYE